MQSSHLQFLCVFFSGVFFFFLLLYSLCSELTNRHRKNGYFTGFEGGEVSNKPFFSENRSSLSIKSVLRHQLVIYWIRLEDLVNVLAKHNALFEGGNSQNHENTEEDRENTRRQTTQTCKTSTQMHYATRLPPTVCTSMYLALHLPFPLFFLLTVCLSLWQLDTN